MQINDKFDQRVILDTQSMGWVASPQAGVERKMLDRIGGEVARATSLVRYAPASQFAPHVHGGGEEFFVLSGLFQDEHGDYPAGTYVRNPIGTQHRPGSAPGCVILVKLRQFHPDDTRRFSVRTDQVAISEWQTIPGEGKRILILHDFTAGPYREAVTLEHWDANYDFAVALPRGGEFLILNGACSENDRHYRAGTWLRYPPGSSTTLRTSVACLVFAKRHHLKPILGL